MLVESIAIVLIIVFIVFVFLRSNRKEYAAATAPLVILPFFHILAFLVDDLFSIVLSTNLKAGVDIFGLVVSVSFIAMMSTKLKSKRSRTGYLLVCTTFTTALALIFIFNHYAPFF